MFRGRHLNPFEGPRRWIRVRPRRATIEQDVDDEIRFHLEARVDELIGQGLAPQQALEAALREFGSPDAAAQELRRLDRRSTRRRAGWYWWSDLGRDIRFAVRGLGRRPGFTAAMLLTLALGIGATAAIFTVVQAALLRPLPYHEPDRLVHITETSAGGTAESEASYPDFRDWREQAGLAGLEGFDPANVTVSIGEEARFLRAARVTAGFFQLLGVLPALGRTFQPGEDGPGGSPVVLLSHEYWARELGRRPVGELLMVNGQNHQIIGVLPPGFHFVPAGHPELWLPVHQSAEVREARINHWLNVFGRLPPGVSIDDAATRLSTLMQRLAQAWPASNSGRDVRIRPLRETVTGPVRPVLLSLFGAVGLLLLIACVNVAGLLLARAMARTREIAVRLALGATHSRLVRQLVTESLVLSLTGATLGLALAYAGVRLLTLRIPAGMLERMAYLQGLRPDTGVLLFTALVAVLAGVLLGLVPAAAARSSLRQGMSGSGSAGPGRRWSGRDLLVAGQLALTVVLLIGSGLAGRSLLRLMSQDPGFDTENILTARIPLSGPRYADGAVQQRFFQQLVDQLKQGPSVRAAGAVTNLPLIGGSTLTYWVDGLPEPPASERWSVVQRGVAGDYFQAMGIPLVAGRTFAPSDDSSATPAIIINQSLAIRHFPDGSPIGRRFRFYALQGSAWEIIGVVGDVKTGPLDRPAPPSLYYSHLQSAENRMTLVLRTDGRPESVIPELRRAVRETDPALPLHDVRTMEAAVAGSSSVVARRYPLIVIGGFAATALVLALVGVYGVVAYSVARRARELAVRAALGASRAQLIGPVIRHGAGLALAATVAGVILALFLARFLAGTLYGVAATDPVTYLGVALLLVLVTTGATLIPAGRAAATDPATAFRAE